MCCELCRKKVRLTKGSYYACADAACSCHKMLCHSPTQSWEEEFELVFNVVRREDGSNVSYPNFKGTALEQEIKSFIKDLLAKRDARLLAEIEHKMWNMDIQNPFKFAGKREVFQQGQEATCNGLSHILKSFITNRDN